MSGDRSLSCNKSNENWQALFAWKASIKIDYEKKKKKKNTCRENELQMMGTPHESIVPHQLLNLSL